MPRVAVPLNDITRAGLVTPTPVNADVASGHSVQNDGNVFLLVGNSAATATRTTTFRTPGVVDEQAVADRTVAVPISSEKYVGPFPPSDYGSTLEVDVDHADTRLTAFRLG
jgi:hypothetical protein